MFVASYRNTEAGIIRRAAPQVAIEKQMEREARIRAEARAEAIAEVEENARRVRSEILARWEAQKRAAILAAATVQATKVREPDAPMVKPHRTFEQIERTACRVFDVKASELRSGRRNRHVVFARQFVMYWAARLTRLSMPQISKRLGGRDHTTCLHGKAAYVEKRKAMNRTLRPAR